MTIQYTGAKEITGSIIQIETKEAFFGERAIIQKEGDKKMRNGQVISISGDRAYIQVFEGTSGFSLTNIRTQLTGKPFRLKLSPEILGRVFDGFGNPIDDLGDIEPEQEWDIEKPAINPQSRDYPRGFIQTGISSIDLLTSLVRGQKLPIFSTEGLSHDKLAVQIVSQATNQTQTSFSEDDQDSENYIVFAGIGLKFDTYNFFKNTFMELGNSDKLVTFLNLALSPVAERLLVPKVALTAAEYLAFEMGKNVIVIMTDMTAYCEALRELSATRGEVPGRKGYPSYTYSQLSSIYERAGIIKGKKGSVTVVPILTMPGGDITHPIPDLTGFITEGQIVLSRDFNFYPPIDILPSLSRLMKDAIGEGYTISDHPDVSKKVFQSYAKVVQVRDLAQIIGEEELSQEDKNYLHFGEEFEKSFLQQGQKEVRTIKQTVNIARELLKIIERQ